MIIMLSEDCPLFGDDGVRPLLRILETVADGRHFLASPSPRRLRQLTSPRVWSVFEEHLTQSYKKITNTDSGRMLPANCSGCQPRHLADFCALPTLLLVENATTDGGFVRAIVGTLRPQLRRHFEGAHPRIKIEHGGGIGELPKEILRQGQQYTAVRPAGDVPSRVVVMADSDAPSPGRPAEDAAKVLRAARETGADAHILQKRTIENYLPDGALRRYASTRRDQEATIRMIIELPTTARDHYPMKRGLTAKDRETGLYPDHVPDGAKLDVIADLLANFSYTLEAHDLRLRDGDGDLDRLLDLLEGNL